MRSLYIQTQGPKVNSGKKDIIMCTPTWIIFPLRMNKSMASTCSCSYVYLGNIPMPDLLQGSFLAPQAELLHQQLPQQAPQRCFSGCKFTVGIRRLCDL